jgi:hypothetical protein
MSRAAWASFYLFALAVAGLIALIIYALGSAALRTLP